MASSRDEAIYSGEAATPTFANQPYGSPQLGEWISAGSGIFYGYRPGEHPPNVVSVGQAPTTTEPANPSPIGGGGGGGGGYAVAATPRNPWLTTSTYVAPTGVKQATPDIVLFDNATVDLEFLTNTFFEEFGGQELIKISRADLIDGKEVSYNPIKNLSRLNQQYNPNTVIAIAPFQQNLSKYAIDLVLRGINQPYVDRENGYLVIEIDNVKKSESIEVEIATSGTMNRIIYDY